jgi:hypothetical protein
MDQQPGKNANDNLVRELEQQRSIDEKEAIMVEVLRSKYLDLLESLQKMKPADRSERTRRFAVAITELEKSYAYFETFVK